MKYFQVGLTLLTITIFSSTPSPIKSPKISFLNRNRGDRRTEETTTIKTYQPKYKTLFYFRQLLPNSTFSTIPAETSHKPIPSLVEELSTDPSFIVSSVVEPSVTSFSESTHSQQFPSSFSGSVDSFSPIFSSSDSTSSVPDSVSSADSTTPSSFLPFKPTSSSKFNMPNLLRPSNSMTNFFKSLARSPKASLTPSSTGALSVMMKPPSSVMKPPSLVSFSSSIPQPLDNFSSFSSSSSLFPSQTSISAAESTSSLSLELPPLSTSSVNPSFSDSNSSRFPKDLASSIFSLSTTAGSISSHGSTIIVAASNPSEGSSSLARIPKSLSTAVYSSSSDSSVNGDYNFSYRVNDTKQDFGHSEHRVGNNTQGRYDVVLPDGRRQIVDYQILNASYFADVSYVGETTNQATNFEPASTTSVASLVTNAKIEENMDFPI
ncbi:cell wall protein RBR3-like [Daphnia pulex]|uniref:cell wall protein RBR3-like n=1 Tax=Daphnia pulex TaxID=6669 RepID=UPI001EDCD306|nr:cell wall protein RBR3-like [Daphnia pulex]